MNTTRTSAGGAGTQTAALAFGGRISGPSFTSNRIMEWFSMDNFTCD
jgi:hypothetical protein